MNTTLSTKLGGVAPHVGVALIKRGRRQGAVRPAAPVAVEAKSGTPCTASARKASRPWNACAWTCSVTG